VHRRSKVFLPPLLLIVGLRLYLVWDDVRDDGVVGVALATIFFVGVVLVATLIWMRLRTKRARHTAGSLWRSKELRFIGPSEHDGGHPGADNFIRKHSPKTADFAAPVTMVLTEESLLVFPFFGRGQDVANFPLLSIAAIEIVRGTRRQRGLSFTTADGRRASFLGKVDDELAARLDELGAHRTV
jgi:hypothetical protein